ncbi:MAG: amidohydrolase [Gemmatimonadetes bacterium]|jgi:imidazolonepropionase-like amidohydrolase|nr:amidohydrolase [Gemmatimonadota bacterium]
MRRHILLAVTMAAAASPLAAQSIAITGGRVFPVSGPVIENGTVLIRDGRIVAVGAGVAIPADARRIDAAGRWVTPGLVNAATSVGVREIGAVGSTVETSPRSTQQQQRGISASFNVWEGFNPASVLIPAARKSGITTAAILPQGGLIAGRGAVMHFVAGGGLTEMLMRSPVAMVAELGAGGSTRGEQWSRLREVLDDARSYSLRRAQYERAATRPFAATRLDLEALVPVVEGRLPLLLSVDRASDIEAALLLARDYRLRLIIGGGAEAWMVAGKLAAAKVPVLTGAMNNIPGSFSTLGQRQENAGLLRRAGVPVVIIGNAGGGDEEAFNVRNVRFEAGNAVAYGMTWDDALRAITLTPAEIFGVSDRVGSLQAGRDADVVIWSGDPFEFASQPEHVFLRGVETTTPSRQDLLEQRYRTLPPNYSTPRP